MNLHSQIPGTTPEPRGPCKVALELVPTLAAGAALADAEDRFVAKNYVLLLREAGLVETVVPRELGGGGYELCDLADMLQFWRMAAAPRRSPFRCISSGGGAFSGLAV